MKYCTEFSFFARVYRRVDDEISEEGPDSPLYIEGSCVGERTDV